MTARVRRLIAGLRALVRRSSADRELDDEIQSYLDESVNAKLTTGMTPEAARKDARAELGSPAAIRDYVKDVAFGSTVRGLGKDVALALRVLRRSPGYSLAAVAILGLGIGASTAVFSALDAVVLRALPFPSPDRLVAVGHLDPTRPAPGLLSIAPQDFLDWQARQGVFEHLAGMNRTSVAFQEGAAPPEELLALRVSWPFFDLLRVRMSSGNGFTAANDIDRDVLAAVISHRLWQSRFGEDQNVIGRVVSIDGTPHRIIGVTPPGFAYPLSSEWRTEIWLPLTVPADQRIRQRGRISANLEAVGRLRDGISLGEARADMDRLAAALMREYPEWNRNHHIGVIALHEHVMGAGTRGWMLLLFGAVSLVMLIVCANVANLILARTLRREQEITIRAAIGASRWRIARQLLVESVVLWAIGAAVGLTLAAWTVPVLRSEMPADVARATTIALRMRVLAAALCAAGTTGVLFGLLPAIRCSRPDLATSLREAGRSASAGPPAHRLRNTLVAAEIALAIVLLVGAGLFTGSFITLMQTDVGYSAERVLMAGVFPRSSAAPAGGWAAMAEIVDRVSRLPGVESASFLAGTGIFTNSISRSSRRLPGRPEDRVPVYFSAVTDGHLATLRIPLRRGRFFRPSEVLGGDPVVVLSETAARAFFPDRDAVGQTFDGARIIGVVGDIRFNVVGEIPTLIYVPLSDAHTSPPARGRLLVRTSGDPKRSVGPIRAVVQDTLPGVPLSDVETIAEAQQRYTAQRRLSMALVSLFGLLGLIVAAVGVYGVVAQSVAERTHEIGIRAALGATRMGIVAVLVGQTGRLIVIGLAAGLAGAWLLSAAAKPFLYGFEPTDPRAFGAAAIVLAASALAATLVPALRAARLDPLRALREE